MNKLKLLIFVFFFGLISLPALSQEITGDWVLEKLILKGGKFNDYDKMLKGDGLEIHLGKNSHLSITVIYNDKTRVKHKNTWYEGDSFIILNDSEWGNQTYNILKISKEELTLERMVGGGKELILEFVKRTKHNHHHHNFEIVNE